MRRARGALAQVQYGRRYGYPRCCVLWFALGCYCGVYNHHARRGGVDAPTLEDPHSGYVPCRWHAWRKPAGYRPSLWRRMPDGGLYYIHGDLDLRVVDRICRKSRKEQAA